MSFNNYFMADLEDGIRSLELRYTPIFSPTTKEIIAYRTATTVYSPMIGTITERDYAYAVDFGNDTGIRLSEWNIREGIAHINRLYSEEIDFDFISVKCTASYADSYDVVNRVKAMISEGGLNDGVNLCLEFPQSIFYLAGENARKNIIDLKNIGVRTMISGVGSCDCPVANLANLPVDLVMLDPFTTALAQSRNRSEVFKGLCSALSSMHIKIYAECVRNDLQILELRRFDIKGVTLSDAYDGSVEQVNGDASIDDIVLSNSAMSDSINIPHN